ncbi:hypothetical protein TruAng_012257 [Truncatella angustata]|nr:hypothetical protein TruAng_012257 [Truncatella angustata]
MTAIEIRHTPIHLAVRSGNGPITELLLSHGADVNSISKRMCDCRPLYRTYLAIDPEYEWTPLHIAMCGNRLSTMKLLMARGASFNVGCQGNEEVSLGVTALHSASILGNLSVLVAVLQHYAPDINTPDTTGLTPLLWAYLSEYLGKTLWKVIEFLLEQGANINAVDEHGDSLLLIACNIGRFDDAVWLIEHGADVRLTARRSGTTALHTICKVTYNDATSGRSASQRNAVRFPNSKRLVLARTLLEAGADVDAMDAEGDVALVSAARCCHLGLIELLLDHGANPNVRAKRDETALLAACSTPASVPAYVLKDTVELLLERGASIHAQTDIGKTVLDVLCVLRSNSSMYTNSDREVIASMVRTFLRSGIRPIGAPGSEQSLVLQYFMGGYLACSKLLIEYGAMHPTPNGLKKMIAHAIKCDDIEAIQFVLSFEGAKKLMATPSRLAASLKTATDGVVELLMDNGAPYKYITKDGTSCLHYACARPLLKIDFFRKLLEGGANLNASTKKGLTPLKAAIKIRRLELVELLLEYGADPDYTGSAEVAISGESSPLVMASQSGRMDILAALLRRSKDAHNPLWQQISSADPTGPGNALNNGGQQLAQRPGVSWTIVDLK